MSLIHKPNAFTYYFTCHKCGCTYGYRRYPEVWNCWNCETKGINSTNATVTVVDD